MLQFGELAKFVINYQMFLISLRRVHPMNNHCCRGDFRRSSYWL